MKKPTFVATLPSGSVCAFPVGIACLVLFIAEDGVSNWSVGALAAILAVVVWLVARLGRVRREVSSLVSSEARFRALVQRSSDATLILADGLTVQYASPAAEQVFGRPASSLEGVRLETLLHPSDVEAFRRFVRSARPADSDGVAAWRVRGRSGAWLWTENTVADLGHEPAVGGVVLNCRDISDRRNLEARLTRQAFHDALTGLANRALFVNRVSHAVDRASRVRHPASVLFLDLDDFKKVNDSLGHAVGDELLVACAGRLSACVRPGDTIARLGGDEFAILLDEGDGVGAAARIAERISTAIRAPFRMQGRDVFIGVSIGIAGVALGESVDEVLRNADLAMYFAKGRGKGHYATYHRSMHEEVLDRLELEAHLRQAVDAGEVRVEYQPIVHLATGEIYGAEALVRWRHPERGDVDPSRFVKLAEETGLIVPIGRMVLGEACARAREWRERYRGARALRMCVNLSGRHFQEASLVDDVMDALRGSGLDGAALTLEITESVLMKRSEPTLGKLRSLKALGLQLAIDDFGTGYSSLGYLQQFPIDVLKIDRTFVEQVGMPHEDSTLARAIIALGRTLRIETIAEGIERPQQRDALRSLGCTLGQGFFFARPMPADDFAASLAGPARPPTVIEMYAPEPLRPRAAAVRSSGG